MGLTYAGVALPLATPRLEEYVAQLNPQDFQWWDAWQFEGYGTERLPTPSYPALPPIRLGVLYWPTGAVRPAHFHFVCNKPKLDEIRTAIGCPASPQPLVMSDGRDGKTITAANMYMLPPRPLFIPGEGTAEDVKDSYLVTLVDQRFYWHWKPGSISSQPASWASLFTEIGSILGVSIGGDGPDAAYQTPSYKWIGYYRPIATVLDAAAAQIGHRVVVNLDASVRTITWETAKGESDGQLAANALVMAGGEILASDIARYVPSGVKVLFADWSAGGSAPADAPYVVTEYLSGLDVTGTLADYSGCLSGGFDTSFGTIPADFGYASSNLADVTGYAEAAAEDWYGWRLASTDLVFPGIEPWAPTGWEDAIEWTYQIRQGPDGKDSPFASTRVRRAEWDAFPSGDFTSNSPSGQPPDNTGGSSACRHFGWLLSGPRSNKTWRIRVSEATGQCTDCTTIDAAFDDVDPSNNRYALWTSSPSSTQEIWDVVGNFILCGGCATARILTDRAATTPEKRVQLELTYRSVIDGSLITKTFDGECTPDDSTVVWAVATDDGTLCPDPASSADFPCSSTIRIVAECRVCEMTNPECALCATDKGPAVWKVVGSGFTDTYSDYNGTWYLTSTSDCSWSVTCGGITVSLALENASPTAPTGALRFTLTFSGASGGSAVYTVDDINRACDTTQTLSRSSGDVTKTPATVDAEPIVCTALVDYCQQLIDEGATFTATITSKTGTCTCVGDSYGPFSYNSGNARWELSPSDNFSCPLLDCEENAEIIIQCVNGQFQFGAGGTQTLVSYSRNPFMVVLDKSIDAGAGIGTYRVTITKN